MGGAALRGSKRSAGGAVVVVKEAVPVVKVAEDSEAHAAASHTSCYTSETKKDSYDSLPAVLAKGVADVQLRELLVAALAACQRVSDALRSALVTVEGTSNKFGDVQLTVDVVADKLLFEFAESCALVHQAASEEAPELRLMNEGGRFVLCWDPLDGSSIVDNNWAVGTLVGIWDRRTGLIGANGRDQLSSMVVQYGPRTTALLALDDGAYEFTLQKDGVWLCSRERIQISRDTKMFAPANLRATQDLPGYAALVDHWTKARMTLRYTGGLVPDVYQQFTKKQGIFANPTSPSSPAKLRIAFEAAPFALLVERAGGRSSDGVSGCSLLDVEIKSIDQRTALCLGSANEVSRFNEMVLGIQTQKVAFE